MEWIFEISNFLIGTCLASHACVIVERAGKDDFIFSRSKCTNCNQQLCLLDEIPLISYLVLKGRCRYCKVHIPCEYFFTEFLGGFAFCKINFGNIQGIYTAIVLFSLLLTAISDYQVQEFDIILVFPALVISVLRIMNNLNSISIIGFIQFFPVFLLLLFETIRKKCGSGDLIVYLILSFYFSPKLANLTFLIASITLLIVFFSSEMNEKQPIAFIPFIYIGLIIQLLCK